MLDTAHCLISEFIYTPYQQQLYERVLQNNEKGSAASQEKLLQTAQERERGN
jgi:hypothetical protein